MVTVAQILAQCDAFKGQPVQAAGYLAECHGYDCHLFTDKKGRETWSFGSNSEIGIGGGHAFDLKAAPFQNSYVVITGRVDKDNCSGAGGADRSVGIEPTDIRAWIPPKSGAKSTLH